MTTKNLHTTFNQIIPRKEKEIKLAQRAKVFWFTGLSGSGKTTLAVNVEKRLFEMGFLTQVLDGDNVRTGINSNLGFSFEERKENIRRIAEVSKLFLNCGIITLNCFVSPAREMRSMARKIIGKSDFVEIFVNTPIELCEERDVKGLYSKARKGLVTNFTGIHESYEPPLKPEFEIKTENKSVAICTEEILNFILQRIKLNKAG